MTPSQQAQANYQANRDALARTQAWLLESFGELPHSEFIVGRDGSLTAIQEDGLWLDGCSVPRSAAQEQLKTLELRANVGCFLDPRHGQHVLVAMERLRSDQALIAVFLDVGRLQLALQCVDLSACIADGRVFACAGLDCARQLERILDENGGLPTPAAFVRTILSEESVLQEMIQQAQKVFADVLQRRNEAIAGLLRQKAVRSSPPRLLVIAPSRFRLWDDGGWRLGRLLSEGRADGVRVKLFDPDRPTTASPLALAQAMAGADAVLAADVGRADLPAVASTCLPWLTTVTRPRIPAVHADGPADRLILSDPGWSALAEAAGWPVDRIAAAALPPLVDDPPPPDAPVVIMADTRDTAGLGEKFDYSSHRLLWELVEGELREDPLRVGRDPVAYLRPRMRRLEIVDEGFDFAHFIDHLVVPCYQQSLARQIMRAGVRLAVHGEGWGDLPEFKTFAGGPVRDHQHFAQIVQDCAAIVHVWPVAGPHPADWIGRTVVRPEGSMREFLARLKNPTSSNSQPPPGSVITAAMLANPCGAG